MQLVFIPAFDDNGVPNQWVCCDCHANTDVQAGPSVIVQTDRGDYLEELCLPCAVERYPEASNVAAIYWQSQEQRESFFRANDAVLPV